jgi:hypothetical protein
MKIKKRTTLKLFLVSGYTAGTKMKWGRREMPTQKKASNKKYHWKYFFQHIL